MADLIDRKTALDAIKQTVWLTKDAKEVLQEAIEKLPSADIDLSGFSDKLWRAAYERGKAEAVRHDVTDTNVGDMISRQAAIDALDVLCEEHRYKIPGKRETYSQYNEAWQDALDRAEGAIGNLPSADAVEVVRCADCKHCQVDNLFDNYWCDGQSVWAGHYCSKGERKDG